MIKNFLPVLAVATFTSVAYFFNSFTKKDEKLLERKDLITIIIALRKSMFSTLREIAYAANFVHIESSDIQPRKIKDILMRDASAQMKLNVIEELVMARFHIQKETFEHSCNYYSMMGDMEIKMLLQSFKSDLNLALEGTIQSYQGPLPRINSTQTIRIYREIITRRMKIIEDKFINQVDNKECLRKQHEIEDYLECEGIKHEKEACQKIFLSLLQYNYKSDSSFKYQFESLQIEFEQFIDQIKKKKKDHKILSQNV